MTDQTPEEDDQHNPEAPILPPPPAPQPGATAPAPQAPQAPPQALPPTPVKPSSSSKKNRRIAIIVTASTIGGLLLLALGIASGAAAMHFLHPNALPSLSSQADGNTAVTAQESSIASIAEKVGPSVV